MSESVIHTRQTSQARSDNPFKVPGAREERALNPPRNVFKVDLILFNNPGCLAKPMIFYKGKPLMAEKPSVVGAALVGKSSGFLSGKNS